MPDISSEGVGSTPLISVKVNLNKEICSQEGEIEAACSKIAAKIVGYLFNRKYQLIINNKTGEIEVVFSGNAKYFKDEDSSGMMDGEGSTLRLDCPACDHAFDVILYKYAIESVEIAEKKI